MARRYTQSRVARLEGLLGARALRACPACRALEPGGSGGALLGGACLLPVAGEPGRAHVSCASCGRSALASFERLPSGGVAVAGCEPAAMPV